MPLTPVQQEAVDSLIRILGAAGLAGAGVRAGYGVLRNANPGYEPPEIPKPLIVDMPYPSRGAPVGGAIPLPKRQKLAPMVGADAPATKFANDPLAGSGAHKPSVPGPVPNLFAPPAAPPALAPDPNGFGTRKPFTLGSVPNPLAPPVTPPTPEPNWSPPAYDYREHGTHKGPDPEAARRGHLFTLPFPHPLRWARDGGMSPGGKLRMTPEATVGPKDLFNMTPVGRVLSTVRRNGQLEQDHKDFRTIKNNFDKSANPADWTLQKTIEAFPGGEWLWKALPRDTPMGGRPEAAGPMEIPAYGLAAMPVAAAGGIGGYYLADKILRAADRRHARSDLDAAQAEYRKAVLDRITRGQTGKVAADFAKLASAQTPDDPDLRRTKVALDRAFAKAAAGEDDPNYLINAAKHFFYPGFIVGPETGTVNMGIAGALGALGAYSGYSAGRNREEAMSVRKRISDVDKENAKKIPAPVIARLIPVAPDKI